MMIEIFMKTAALYHAISRAQVRGRKFAGATGARGAP
jgi:hypothetical protein